MFYRTWAIVATVLVVVLATGWGVRERSFAADDDRLESRTVNLSDLKFKDIVFDDTVRGDVAIFFEGETAGTRDFVTGIARIRPGLSPHPVHKHPEEE
ncbi:MAG: hypothetical protein AB7K24_11060, partial [Gemmataceae bacterium]